MSETAAKKDVQKLQRAIVDGLEDVKAQDIRVFWDTLAGLRERGVTMVLSSHILADVQVAEPSLADLFFSPHAQADAA